ncbi:MAG: hypothetical protein QM808_08495 [Steroidobacteraceae bacterium]
MASSAALAQTAKAAAKPRAPTWADVAKWPDFTGGEWVIKGSLVNTSGASGAPLKPELAARPAAPQDAAADGCKPRGLPGLVGGEFFYDKDSILLVVDFDYLVFRRIFMDGRSHEGADPTYFGHSVGHWEGKTLVVDTAALLPEVPVGRVPGNGATHIVERFEPVDSNTLSLTITLTNPEVLTGPWVIKKTLVRLPELEVREAFCQQNDRNAPVNGKANTDLTPPK